MMRRGGRRWGRGLPKLTWEQVVGTDAVAGGINGTIVEDRSAWKIAIRRPDPAPGGRGRITVQKFAIKIINLSESCRW